MRTESTPFSPVIGYHGSSVRRRGLFEIVDDDPAVWQYALFDEQPLLTRPNGLITADPFIG
ncbi:MAG TPA: hypothetical protein VMU19_06600 [Bryobacteraceae bacterium]|nr:hypothetical protein [Bryobacteraceae bacterium]